MLLGADVIMLHSMLLAWMAKSTAEKCCCGCGSSGGEEHEKPSILLAVEASKGAVLRRNRNSEHKTNKEDLSMIPTSVTYSESESFSLLEDEEGLAAEDLRRGERNQLTTASTVASRDSYSTNHVQRTISAPKTRNLHLTKNQ